MKRLLPFILILFNGTLLRGTHIIGGELYYDCLGNNQYKITLKVYRDCFNGQAPFDNPANITVWNGNGGFVQNISIPFPGSTNVPFIAGNPCFQAPATVCVEEAVYTTIVTLPASPSGYVLAYQRCCRNNTIVNLVSPQSTGATYTETIPPSGPNVCNNSPRFNNFPPIALCIGDNLVFDHSATDPDGDSLVYELCATYAGGSPSDPMPIPTSPPPFDEIIFQNPYSINNPIASNPPISINSQTGVLNVSPTQLGQYVVGVCVKEYRNGVLIGTHRRDFQFNVVNCTVNVNAEILLPQSLNPLAENLFLSCGEFTVNFSNIGNSSIGNLSYLWNFGDPNTTNDVSNLPSPTYTYSDTGTFTAQLILNPGFFCSDTDQVTIILRPDLDVDFTVPPGQCIDGNLFNLTATGNWTAGATLSWNFGPNATPAGSNQSNASVSFNSPGFHPVTFKAEDLFCRDSVTKNLLVYGHPSVTVNMPDFGCEPFTTSFGVVVDEAYNQMVYQWDLGNGTTSNDASPTVTYNAGVYSISLLAYATTGCQDTFNFNWPNYLHVYPVPQAGFTVQPEEQSIFHPFFQFFDESSGGVSCWFYFGNGDSTDACTTPYEYTEAGNYTVMQIVINEFGCPDTAIRQVIVTPEFTFFIPNTFTINDDGLNETFRGYGIGIGRLEFRIYDRWGKVIFYTEDPLEAWNGRHMNTGPKVPPDIYVYAFDVWDVFGLLHRYRGKVLLKRDGEKKQ
jgi:gliding motility-associated-like protein